MSPPSAPFVVAFTSLKVICSGMPPSRRFGAGADVCRFGCQAMGGDDVRHYLFCPSLAAGFAHRSTLRRPGWLAGGDLRSLLFCFPLDATMTITHAVWHCAAARAVMHLRHRWGVASCSKAQEVLFSELRGLLARAPALAVLA